MVKLKQHENSSIQAKFNNVHGVDVIGDDAVLGANKHQSAVTCLQFNRRFVVTSSDDGTVKIWDLRSGDFLRNLVALDSGGSGGVVWRIRCSNTTLVCAVGSRNGTEETKLLVLDFDVSDDESNAIAIVAD